jgi:hypothetical protein
MGFKKKRMLILTVIVVFELDYAPLIPNTFREQYVEDSHSESLYGSDQQHAASLNTLKRMSLVIYHPKKHFKIGVLVYTREPCLKGQFIVRVRIFHNHLVVENHPDQ